MRGNSQQSQPAISKLQKKSITKKITSKSITSIEQVENARKQPAISAGNLKITNKSITKKLQVNQLKALSR